MGTPGCSLRSIIILALSSASSTVAPNTKPTGWKVAILSAGRGVAKLAGPLAMAYSEPSIRPKIRQIIWLRTFAARRGGPVLAAVIDEIVQNAPQQFAVGRYGAVPYCRAVQRQSLAVAIGQNGVHCLAQGQRFGVDRVLAGAQLGQLKQAVDQGLQVGLPGVDSLQIALAGSFIGGYALQQGLGISADGGQRAFDVPLA